MLRCICFDLVYDFKSFDIYVTYIYPIKHTVCLIGTAVIQNWKWNSNYIKENIELYTHHIMPVMWSMLEKMIAITKKRRLKRNVEDIIWENIREGIWWSHSLHGLESLNDGRHGIKYCNSSQRVTLWKVQQQGDSISIIKVDIDCWI